MASASMDLERNLDSLSIQSDDESKSALRIKVASNVFFLYNDEEGFGNAIAQSLSPIPQSCSKEIDVFPLGLPDYDVRHSKLTGSVAHLRDDKNFKATMVALNHLEPPILSHAIYAILAKIANAEHISFNVPTIIAPFLVPASKLKLEGGYVTTNSSRLPLYSIQVGPETDVSRAIAAKTQRPPPTSQIHFEPLACFLQLVRAANLPTCIIVGQRSQSPLNRALDKDLEILYEIGELMASTTGTYFHKEQTKNSLVSTARPEHDGEEPWRAFYA